MLKITTTADIIREYPLRKKTIPHQTTAYMIVPYDSIKANINKILPFVCESSVDTIRHTIDGIDKIILKWKPLDYSGDIPSGLLPLIETKENEITMFTYDEILVEIQKEEWQSKDPLEPTTTTKTTTKSIIEIEK